MNIETVVVSDFQQNCSVLWEEGSGDAVVVDPGADAEKILSVLSAKKLQCKEIWLTHSHLDHCGAVKPLLDQTAAKLIGHPVEKEMRAMVKQIALMYGIPDGAFENCPEPDRLVSGGETLSFGSCSFQVLFTPGHSPGHVCFYCAEKDMLIAGDTVFSGSIGRTDLPGGDHETLMQSIAKKILILPGATKIYPGHGSTTTIEQEKNTNPFLQEL